MVESGRQLVNSREVQVSSQEIVSPIVWAPVNLPSLEIQLPCHHTSSCPSTVVFVLPL